MARAGSGSSRPLSAPSNAPREKKESINSLEKKEYDDTDSERSLLLARTDSESSIDASTQPPYQTFEAFGDASHNRPVEQYEGRHRYDPRFEWKPKEERKLVRKVRICV